jgi:Bacterial dnaA protein helix-turn-helix/Sigma-70, region 4
MDYFINLDNSKEKEEFLKTRTDSLLLPKDIKNTLLRSDVRTVRGLISKSPKELKQRFGFIKADLDIITQSLDKLVAKILGYEYKTIPSREIGSTLVTTLLINQKEADRIIDMFSAYFDVEKHFLIGRDRRQETVMARDVIVYILRTHGGMSFPAIGRLLGGRDHTTIIHAYTKIANKVKTDKDFENDFSSLIDEVKKFKESALEIEKTSGSILKHFASSKEFVQKSSQPIQISQRYQKILDLYRQGLVLNDIGKKVGITRERARQIIVKTLKQIAFNDSLATGTKVDFDTLQAKEKESRRLLIESKKPIKKTKPAKVYRWSVYYDSCKVCETTETKHYKHGLCEECGNKSIVGPARENMILEHDNKCDLCGKSREQNRQDSGRDFFLIRKTKSVFCRECFLTEMGKRLADSKRNRWKMFYN